MEELIEDIDKEELGAMLPELHKQGIGYDDLKDATLIEIQSKIVIPEIDENMVDDMKDFFASLEQLKIDTYNTHAVPECLIQTLIEEE